MSASCHGLFREGEGRWPALVGGEGSLAEDRQKKPLVVINHMYQHYGTTSIE
ncbi:MAG: hypothetical protein P1U35_00920 [Cycloclasticus sp.]|jgi:hypothetical protein|nr:hypothetical protein [Cycloclasticus sp.]